MCIRDSTSTDSVNNTARLKLQTSGGTAQFFAFAAASTVLQSRASGTADLSIYADGASKMRFYTNGDERLRIDSSGNIGAGIAPSSGARLWIATNDNPFVGTRYNAGADGSVLFLQHSRSNTIGTNVALNDNDEVGTVQFRAYASNNSSVKVLSLIHI